MIPIDDRVAGLLLMFYSRRRLRGTRVDDHAHWGVGDQPELVWYGCSDWLIRLLMVAGISQWYGLFIQHSNIDEINECRDFQENFESDACHYR